MQSYTYVSSPFSMYYFYQICVVSDIKRYAFGPKKSSRKGSHPAVSPYTGTAAHSIMRTIVRSLVEKLDIWHEATETLTGRKVDKLLASGVGLGQQLYIHAPVGDYLKFTEGGNIKNIYSRQRMNPNQVRYRIVRLHYS